MATPIGIDLSGWSHQALEWSAGLAVALMVRGFVGRPWHVAGAWGLFAVPVAGTYWGILDSLSVLADPGSVLRAFTVDELTRLTYRKLLTDLGYLVLGALLWVSGGRWRGLWDAGPAQWATWLRERGVPLGRGVGGVGGEGPSAWAGLLLFPVLLFATLGADLATQGVGALRNGDEANVWRNMTIPLALLLALAAGVGEELLYRGVILGALRKVMPAWPAVVAQAVFFGFAHAGYGTWIHLLGATAFGLFAGAVAWRWGLWAAIVPHVLIDVYAWGPDAAVGAPWFAWVLWLFLLANTLLTAGWAVRWAFRRVAGQGQRFS